MESSNVLHITKYGSEVLLGMKTSVSAGKSKQLNSDQRSAIQVETIADFDASASIISWDLGKKVNRIILEKGEATMED